MASLTLSRAYDPSACKLIIAGFTVTGYMDGTAITWSKNEDTNYIKVGIDGDHSGAIGRDHSGSIKFTVQQTAKSTIDFISKLVITGRTSRLIEFPISFVDPSGVQLPPTTCIFKKQGDVGFGKEVAGIEYEFWVADADIVTNLATGVVTTVANAIAAVI